MTAIDRRGHYIGVLRTKFLNVSITLASRRMEGAADIV